MEVRVFAGTHAYAMIAHDGGSLDIRLNPGRSAARALREYCDDQERQAAEILERVSLARQAAAILDLEAAQ